MGTHGRNEEKSLALGLPSKVEPKGLAGLAVGWEAGRRMGQRLEGEEELSESWDQRDDT